MLKQILMVGLCAISLLPAHKTEALSGDHGRYRDRVEVRYRNAGERILSNTADRVIDKIFGPKRQERSFTAKVISSIDHNPSYSLMSLGNLVVILQQNDGYRADAFVDNIDIFKEFSQGLSSYGIHCLSKREVDSKAEESARATNVSADDFENYKEGFKLEYYPTELVVYVKEYNARNVSLEVEMFDNRQKINILRYRGIVSVPDMSSEEKDKALLAIIKNFMDNYATL